MARAAFESHGPPELVEPSDLPSDGLIVPCGLVGAPTLMSELIQSGTEAEDLLRAVEGLDARPVVGMMPFEIGGSNGLLPLAWASRLKLPVIDADMMGRAFPVVPQFTPNLVGIPPSPVVLVDGQGTTLVVLAGSAEQVERRIRPIVAGLGGVAMAALYLLAVSDVERACIPGSITRALALGRAVLSADTDPVEVVVRAVGGRELIDGRIVDVAREMGDGFVRGHAIVQRLNEDPGSAGDLLRLETQNEILAALLDGEILACTPDVISVLDAYTGQAIGTERLRYGQRVRVVAFPGDSRWLTPQGLAVAGPEAFGYDFPYRPIAISVPSIKA
jgi:hypothetical protein